ncbi:NYN domain-containing protein [Polyangium jinanense]|uniref:NYN domain-containing protein n=1 Tax=Polyangium jinanense TaxID=2829994 RepID=A0A9X3WXE9_9BACT|nr:NYN domain-containing protein [Polyangium jinanense]MDC3952406.1 NYN domain-containing protein [Polyangium jinanense]MDC3980034.1 NYN domain-containing protein [Polyangium jinanense]
MPQAERIRTALFVDFDNIYLGLHRVDPEAAEVFATEPTRWLAWMERGLIGKSQSDSEPGHTPLSVLVRKCYLNPKTFHKYRPYFTRAAFEVVDCPPLTSLGKTSSDIRMVMDILDTLGHPTRFDKFVIMSGDADFTPVLLRLRAHDRRTVVVAVGYAASAYIAACDRLITEDRFIEDTLRVPGEGEGFEPPAISPPQRDRSFSMFPSASIMPPPASLPAGDAGAELLSQMAAAVVGAARAGGSLPAASLPRVYRRFHEFSAASDWLGFKSLRALTEELCRRDVRLRIVDDEAESWRVTTDLPPAPSLAVPTAPTQGLVPPPPSVPMPMSSPAPSIPLPPNPNPNIQLSTVIEPSPDTLARPSDLRAEIVRVLRDYVSSSPRPVTMASASQEVIRRLGNVVVDSRWAGTGSFKDLLLHASDPGFVVHTASPGHLFDPTRHEPPEAESEDWPPPSRDEFGVLRRVHEITGVPVLRPPEFGLLFRTIADILGRSSFQVTATSKSVRDALLAEGHSVSRSAVTFVLRGIMYGGLPLHEAPKPWGARLLAEAFQRNVLAMCEDAELNLSTAERAAIERWLIGAIEEVPAVETTDVSGTAHEAKA